MILKITDADNHIYTIYNNKIMSSSLKSDSSDDSDFRIGNASAISYNASIYDDEDTFSSSQLKKSKIELYTDENVLLYTMTIDDASIKKNIINISCIDKMIDFDVKFVGGIFPCSILVLLQQICLQCNITLLTTTFDNYDKIILNNNNLTNITCRDILSYICEASGTYAIINSSGELELKWYDYDNIDATYTFDDLFDYERDETKSKISGVAIYINETIYNSDLDLDNSIYLTSDNPVIANMSADDINSVIDIVGNKIKVEYWGARYKLLNKPEIRVGQIINIVKDTITYKTIVTNLSISNTLSQSVISTSKAKESNYNSLQNQISSSSESKITMSKNDNAIPLVISNMTSLLNTINIYNVNADTQCFASYTVTFDAINTNEIYFEILTDSNIAQTFYITPKVGHNEFSFSRLVNLFNESSSVVVRLTASSNTINIDIFNSILSVIVKNAVVVKSGLVDSIYLYEAIQLFNVSSKLDINNFSDIELNEITENIKLVINETILTYNNNIRLITDTVSELLTTELV